ncbi:hypothetical protein P43SY_009326 [Pythium insidiosum]|uniref:SAM-dependent MTase RsmB/NOP-type domain-containing protein n=1 Tax=Pythium insidiosum TaxID=114742 RepID=A0AAD5LG37_PYTIN|nr:hypothetical protein P43SY_009326 [Pythium insidiosum]
MAAIDDQEATPSTSIAWHDAKVWEASGFSAFLQAHGIKRSDLVAQESTATGDGALRTEQRFFRVKQSQKDGASAVIARVVEDLRQAGVPAEIAPRAVAWVPQFFSLPASVPLARLASYQRGEIYGIDISSGFAVSLLDLQPGEHVLDLCCAPGAKLTMIADLLAQRGSVTGVDFSRARLGACKQLVHKYKLVVTCSSGAADTDVDAAASASAPSPAWRCRLFHADGRTFNVGPKGEWTSDADAMEVVVDSLEVASRDAKAQGRKRKNKSARGREQRTRRALDGSARASEAPNELYDKVLVDAECTHDGSVKHLQKLESLDAWATYVSRHLNDGEVARILALQAALLRNGFRLLRRGGTLVYSTCSLSLQQNEAVLTAFLGEKPDAELVPIATTGIPCEPGQVEHTVRFTPAHHTSGLFIAKIRKSE